MKKLLIAGAISMIFGCSGSTTQPSTTGDAGQDGSLADAAQDSASACVPANGDCRANANECCNGAVCVFDANNPSRAICADTCLNDSQCASGCCTILVQGTSAVCAPSRYCAGSCAPPGADCTSQTCCPNSLCVVSTVTGTTCAARCAINSQCISNCCAPLQNTGDLVCSPPQFCP